MSSQGKLVLSVPVDFILATILFDISVVVMLLH